MKFKVDENLPGEVAELLRSEKHEAATVIDERLGGKDDSTITDACRREGLILVTLDLDFGDARTYPPDQSPGCIILRLRNQSKQHILAAVRQAMSLMDIEPLEHRLWIVEEGRVRIRGSEDK